MIRFNISQELNRYVKFILFLNQEGNKRKIARLLLLGVAGLSVSSGIFMSGLPIPALDLSGKLLSAFNLSPSVSGLLFILCGIALVLKFFHRNTGLKVSGGILLFLGFLTFAEDIGGFHPGGVAFFMRNDVTDLNHPASSGQDIYSSLCFIFFGLAFIDSTSKNKINVIIAQYRFHFISILSALVVCGHICSIPFLYKWLPSSEVPYLSSILFFLIAQSASFVSAVNISTLFKNSDLDELFLKKILFKKLFSVIAAAFLIAFAYYRGLVTMEFVFILYITILIFVAGFFVHISSKQVRIINEKRKKVEHLIISSNRELTEKVQQRTKEWKKAFDEVEVQKELFFTLFRKGPVAKVLTNMNDGTIVDCSNAYTRLVGFGREDIIGKTVREFGFDWDAELLNKVFLKIKTSGNAALEDYKVKKEDGNDVWITANFSIISLNKEDHLLSTIFDVTDRKKIENKYKYILQNASDIIYTTDKEGNFEFINESVTKLLGYEISELTGKNFTSVLHEDSRQQTYEFYIHQFTQNIEKTYNEFKIIDKNRQEKWIGQNVKIRRDELNRYIGFQAVARDITERKNLEKDLHLKNERLEEAMHIAKFGYFEQDLIEDTHIYSKEVLEILETEALPNTGSRVIHLRFVLPEHVAEFEAHFDRITKSKQQSSVECQIITFKGNLKHVWIQATPILDKNGHVVLIRGIVKDITARKSTELMLRNAKEISEESIKIKERFLANMSHEIRTPMNAIIGFSHILNDSGLNAKQKEWLKTILSSGESLLVILNDVLDFSKIESGMVQIESIPIPLHESLQSYLTLSKIKADEKGLLLELETREHLPAFIFSDPVRLQQIFTNLLSNAIKFTHNGFVKLSARTLGETKTDIIVEFRVTDSGIGIAFEQQKNIFERFVQESSDTTRKYGGTGLGLSIVKELVLLLNGRIEVKSLIGKGSEFLLVIPFKKCNAQEVVTHQDQNKKELPDVQLIIDELHVLVVEDNKTNQQFMLTVMEGFGFEVTIVNNGKDAIRELETATFDLILMDIQMPVMDGLEATRIIRERLKLSTPIIALTANSGRDEKEKCKEAGMNDYLAKPTIPAEIYSKMKQFLPHRLFVQSRNTNTESNEDRGRTIDQKAILETLNNDDRAFVGLISIFLDDTPQDMHLLSVAIKDKNYLSIEKVAHKLISSFAPLHILQAEALLREIEWRARSQSSISELEGLFMQLSAIYADVELEFKKLQSLY